MELEARSQKEHLAASLTERYWQSFVSWQQNSGVFRSLQVPDDIADVFVPKRILELSENPLMVHARILQRVPDTASNADSIRVMITERLPGYLTDPDVYAAWNALPKPVTREGFYDFPSQVPDGIHYKHYQYDWMVNAGMLDLDELVYLDYMADVPAGFAKSVQTRNFFDRPDLHGKGIAKGFYQRIEDVFRQLGFSYLSGTIASPRPFFFQRNRIPYRWLDARMKAELPPIGKEWWSQYYVRVLNWDTVYETDGVSPSADGGGS